MDIQTTTLKQDIGLDGRVKLIGTIESMGVPETEVALIERPPNGSQDAPTHDIYAKGPSGKHVRVGAAFSWKVKATGAIGYSLVFDDPYFSDVRFKAVPVAEGVWETSIDTFKPEKKAA